MDERVPPQLQVLDASASGHATHAQTAFTYFAALNGAP
jgi:hypothetical protein